MNGTESCRSVLLSSPASLIYASHSRLYELFTNDRCTHLMLIRHYIPKGTDFGKPADEKIAEIEWELNDKPRKSLGYLTSIEYLIYPCI